MHIYINVVFCFVLELHPAMLRFDSWLSTQGSLLAELPGLYVYDVRDQIQLSFMQGKSLIHYIISPTPIMSLFCTTLLFSFLGVGKSHQMVLKCYTCLYAHASLLVLLKGPYEMPRTKPGSHMCKTSTASLLIKLIFFKMK